MWYWKVSHGCQKGTYLLLNIYRLIGGDVVSYLPMNKEEISLIRFVAEYQFLNIKDAKYFFKTQDYYRRRIKHLIDKKLLRKIKLNLVLGELGIEYAKLFNFDYNKSNRNEKYIDRLIRVASIGAYYQQSDTTNFTPSFAIKDKSIFTSTARRFIGIFEINGIEYLTYQISKEHDDRYITSVAYDIQKEKNFKNFIILIDDINRINASDFVFGINQILIIEDTIQNREYLQYLNSINWHKVIDNYFKNDVILSEYNFCDYTNKKNQYFSTFYFIDTEKINRIKYFLRENENKTQIIFCNKNIEDELKRYLPTAKYIPIDLEQYIDKERIFYD